MLIGAFGSHALEAILEANARENTYELANRYQFYHGLALFMIGLGQLRIERSSVAFLCVGILVFSGSLYILSITDIGLFGAVTPIGGIALIIGWISVFRDALAKRNRG